MRGEGSQCCHGVRGGEDVEESLAGGVVEDGIGGDGSRGGGTVRVKSGGVIKNKAGVNITGTGTNIVEAGGTVYFNGEEATAFIGKSDNDNAIFHLENGATFAYNNSSYTLSGAVILKVPGGTTENPESFIFRQSPDFVLHIKVGGTLTIANTSSLTLRTTSSVNGGLVTGEVGGDGVAAAKIVATGHIGFREIGESWENDISNVPNVNFYDSDGAQQTKNYFHGAFDWDADADGSSNAGWKAQSVG